jgi:putative transposase
VRDWYSRRGVGWSIAAALTAALVTHALVMASAARRATNATMIPPVMHRDQGTAYGSWAFTRRARDAGLLPATGAVGTCLDTALLESFWSRV